MRKRLLASMLLGLLYASPAHAQLVGTDTVPGSSCVGFPDGATRMTGDADLNGADVVLVCDGTNWLIAPGGAATPGGADRQVQFNSGGSLAADSNFVFSSTGALGIGTDNPRAPIEIESDGDNPMIILNDNIGGNQDDVSIRNTGSALRIRNESNGAEIVEFVANGANQGTMRLFNVSSMIEFTDTDDFSDPNDRFRINAGPDVFDIQFIDNSAGTVDIMRFDAVGMTTLRNGFSLSGDVSPASIGANQNDYAPTGHATASMLRLTASGAYNITGLAGGVDGRVVTIMNVGTNTITLKNQDAASTAANRFAFGADIVLSADKTVGLIYDSTSQRWRAGGGLPFESGLSGPTGCASIGDLCADGTVFAGWHPINQEHLFIPTVDQERPGSPGTFTMFWKNATGTNDISTDSTNDGQVNHANRVGAIGNFWAFQACEDLSFGGQTDWYLPSQVELYYLWAVRQTIEAGGNITNFQNTNYWSSTESATNDAWYQNFTNGSQSSTFSKTNNNRVRCVRR